MYRNLKQKTGLPSGRGKHKRKVIQGKSKEFGQFWKSIKNILTNIEDNLAMDRGKGVWRL